MQEMIYFHSIVIWRDGRAAEGAPLLREYGAKSSIEGSNPSLSANRYAPVAQLDRVSGYEPGGRRFESFRARHYNQQVTYILWHKNQVTVAILCHSPSQMRQSSVHLKDEHNAKPFHNLTTHPVNGIYLTKHAIYLRNRCYFSVWWYISHKIYSLCTMWLMTYS